MSDYQERGRARRPMGLTVEELASHNSVFRPDLLEGHRVLITGGGSGIGRAFLCARLGAQVMVCGRTEERLAETAFAARELLHTEIAYCVTNVREPEAVETLLRTVWAEFGGLDSLVNSAGGQFLQPAIDFTTKGWLAVIDTNLNGSWWTMQASARRWRDSRTSGNVVNIVSVIDRGLPNVAHTAAARAGVIYLSKSVAVEWAPLNIRVNCLAPGAILSDGIGNYPERHARRLVNSNPMRRLGDTWDVAEAIVFLMAPSGKFITGELIRVDGGGQLSGGLRVRDERACPPGVAVSTLGWILGTITASHPSSRQYKIDVITH